MVRPSSIPGKIQGGTDLWLAGHVSKTCNQLRPTERNKDGVPIFGIYDDQFSSNFQSFLGSTRYEFYKIKDATL
jgi:hypothetical protein